MLASVLLAGTSCLGSDPGPPGGGGGVHDDPGVITDPEFQDYVAPDPGLRVSPVLDLTSSCPGTGAVPSARAGAVAAGFFSPTPLPVRSMANPKVRTANLQSGVLYGGGTSGMVELDDLWVLDTRELVGRKPTTCPWYKLSDDFFVAKGVGGPDLTDAFLSSTLEAANGIVAFRASSSTGQKSWTGSLAAVLRGGGLQPVEPAGGGAGFTRFVVDHREQGCATVTKPLPKSVSGVGSGDLDDWFASGTVNVQVDWEDVPACDAHSRFFMFDANVVKVGDSAFDLVVRSNPADHIPFIQPDLPGRWAYVNVGDDLSIDASQAQRAPAFFWNQECRDDMGCAKGGHLGAAIGAELEYDGIRDAPLEEFGTSALSHLLNEDGDGTSADRRDGLAIGDVASRARSGGVALNPNGNEWILAGGDVLCDDVVPNEPCLVQLLPTTGYARDYPFEVPETVYARDIRAAPLAAGAVRTINADLYPGRGEISPGADSQGAYFGQRFDTLSSTWTAFDSGFLFQAEEQFRADYANRTGSAGLRAREPTLDPSRCAHWSGSPEPGLYSCDMLQLMPDSYRMATASNPDKVTFPTDIETFLPVTGFALPGWELEQDDRMLDKDCGPSGVCMFDYYLISARDGSDTPVQSLLSWNGARPVTVGTNFAMVKNRPGRDLGWALPGQGIVSTRGIFVIGRGGMAGPVCQESPIGVAYGADCPEDPSTERMYQGTLAYDAWKKIGVVVGSRPSEVWTVSPNEPPELQVAWMRVTSDVALKRYPVDGGTSTHLRVASTKGSIEFAPKCSQPRLEGLLDLVDFHGCVSPDRYFEFALSFVDLKVVANRLQDVLKVEVNGADVTSLVDFSVAVPEFEGTRPDPTAKVVRLSSVPGLDGTSVVRVSIQEKTSTTPNVVELGEANAVSSIDGTHEGLGVLEVDPVDAYDGHPGIFGGFEPMLDVPVNAGAPKMQRNVVASSSGGDRSEYYAVPLAILPLSVPGVSRWSADPDEPSKPAPYLSPADLDLDVSSIVRAPSTFHGVGIDNQEFVSESEVVVSRRTAESPGEYLGSLNVFELTTILSEDLFVLTDPGGIEVVTTDGAERTTFLVDDLYTVEQPQVFGSSAPPNLFAAGGEVNRMFDDMSDLMGARFGSSVRDFAVIGVLPDWRQKYTDDTETVLEAVAAFASPNGTIFSYPSAYGRPEDLPTGSFVVGSGTTSALGIFAHEYAHVKKRAGFGRAAPFEEGMADAYSFAVGTAPNVNVESYAELYTTVSHLQTPDADGHLECGIVYDGKGTYAPASSEILRQIRLRYARDAQSLADGAAIGPWTAWAGVGDTDPSFPYRVAQFADYADLGLVGQYRLFAATTDPSQCVGTPEFSVTGWVDPQLTSPTAKITVELEHAAAAEYADVVSFYCPAGVRLLNPSPWSGQPPVSSPCGLTLDSSGPTPRYAPERLYWAREGTNTYEFEVIDTTLLTADSELKIGVAYGPFINPIPGSRNRRPVELISWVRFCSSEQDAARGCLADQDGDRTPDQDDCRPADPTAHPGASVTDPAVDADCNCVALCSTRFLPPQTSPAPQLVELGTASATDDARSGRCLVSYLDARPWCSQFP